ncbi:uncharacterized protein PADG_11751 [Paracoccidioides brasiliensis Pb18]|uniref:Uncharacterized protein n=1 Tax=Paracoccidioides brasiliensis (strain Pb18) TaxID=502780 RepID=A0A0A0HV72_PARBD|nr:uncharacterized protein PADG_11751 [Paracoccidioides brasiliensis Pb18]KGM92213.1 hypothetical protein PADG_11751 [Paracoccidioides brasiliensis Pb18]ODH52368.1 hypothetical protein GX48_01431 [Paracoccidioides brasiliensis]
MSIVNTLYLQAPPTMDTHVFLDHSYSSTEVCNRVTMLEGPPFERELAELKDKCHTTSFPTVFRDTKLPPTRFRRPRITDMPYQPPHHLRKPRLTQ